MQPGYDTLGFISCTGTNFLVRSKAFQECGWSPEYTLTEDFGLGMELKMRHWQVCDTAGVLIAKRSMRTAVTLQRALSGTVLTMHTHAEWDCFVIRTGL
jgi:hypothetical protein